MTAKFIKDTCAVGALENIRDYCKEIECNKCVFNANGFCQFRDAHNAPKYWEVPEDYRTDEP